MNTIKKAGIVLCFLLIIFPAWSQRGWSLRECIDYAIRNNIEIKQQALLVDNSEVQLAISKSNRLPDVNAELGQAMSFGRPPTYTGISQNNLRVANTSASIYTSVPIFSGFKITNEIKRDKLNLQAAMENLKKAKENMELHITSLYLKCLLDKEMVKIYKEVVKLTEKQEKKTEVMVQSGAVPESQLLDIKSQLANDNLNLVSAENELTLSLLYLAQALSLRSVNNFNVLEPSADDNVIDENMASLSLTADQIYDIALGIKPHVKEAEFNLNVSKAEVDVAKSYYWPTLKLGLSLSSMYNYIFNPEDINTGFFTEYQAGVEAQANESYWWPEAGVGASISGIFNFVYNNSFLNNNSFFNQMSDNRNELISLSLSVPVLNWGKTKNKVRVANINMTDKLLALDNVKLALYKEIQEAYTSAISSKTKYLATEKAVQAALESFDYAELRYEVGNMTVFEYNEVQTKLFNTRSEQVQAKYDFLFRTKILDFYRGVSITID